MVKGIVTQPARSFLYDYALKTARHGQMRPGDEQTPGTPCSYADPFMESLLEMLVPKVEAITEMELYPTYSYFRVYKQGDVLKRHKDRPACEVSLTLSLGYKTEKVWPIWLEVDGTEKRCDLEPGDALLYRGIELPHWRDEFGGEHAAQVFLHYVNRNGENRDWAYDKRAGLATAPHVKKVLEQLQLR